MLEKNPLDWIAQELTDLERRDLRRRLTTRAGPQAACFEVEGREWINFASNDYLSLANDPRLRAAADEAAQREGWGSGASPLIVGRAETHRALEKRLAEFERVEAALLFSSGYAANVGAIAALVGRGDAVFSDELNHASIVDGCRLSRADVHVYSHGDWRDLEKRLPAAAASRRRMIVTDSLFSMHGDFAPLAELARLAEKHHAMFMVDEAHAAGLFGERGTGLVEQLGVEQGVHVRVGTLSKALGSGGGFVAGGRDLIDWLANRARSYVFSTAQPSACSAAALAALDIVEQEPERRTEVLQKAETLRAALCDRGWSVGASTSQIVPIVVGPADQALRLAAALRDQGIWAPAIRPPTVPADGACLRLSVTYGHSPRMIDTLLQALAGLRSEML